MGSGAGTTVRGRDILLLYLADLLSKSNWMARGPRVWAVLKKLFLSSLLVTDAFQSRSMDS